MHCIFLRSKGTSVESVLARGRSNTGEDTRDASGTDFNCKRGERADEIVLNVQGSIWPRALRQHDRDHGLGMQGELTSRNQRAARTQGEAAATGQRVLVRRTHELVQRRVVGVHVSARESVSETRRPQPQRWAKAAVPGRQRRSTNPPQRKGPGPRWTPRQCARSTNWANLDKPALSECTSLARHEDTSSTPLRKGAKKARAINHRRRYVPWKERPADTTTKAGAPRGQAQPHKPLKCSSAKPQLAEIERMADTVSSKASIS